MVPGRRKTPEVASMRRRVALGILAGLALASWILSAAGSRAGAPARPNVIVILTDDDTLSRLRFLNGAPSGPTVASTFRRLHLNWNVFDRAYVTTPVCTPSRASIFTGQYAHRTGIHFNTISAAGATDGGCEGFTQQGLDQSTLATWLHDAGYRTTMIGKYLNNYPQVTNRPRGFVPPGWDEWHALFNLGQTGGYFDFSLSDDGVLRWYLRNGDANYGTDVHLSQALAAIASTPASQPFFLHFAPVAPHAPAVPAPRHAALRPTLRAPRPPANPAYQEADVSDKNAYIRALPRPAPADQVQEEDALYRNGANSLASVAEAVVAMANALDAAGRLRDTIFVFTTDNGWSFFEHRLRGKHSPYEPSTHVYLVVAAANPSLVATRARRAGLVANVDLAPTIAELCGVPIPGGHVVNGRSFAPTLRSASTPPPARTDVLLENFGPEPVVDPTYPSDFPQWRAVVTGPGHATPGWKYVELATGERELYDLANDPFELTNVAEDPANATLVAALAARLAELASE
jgi:N-acetylglucosamine-6-sulfatase